MGAGSLTPRGEAKATSGGFAVTGRWSFVSGCLHSKWLLGNCLVTENGQARSSPLPDVPETRFVLFPAEQGQILDTWSVSSPKARVATTSLSSGFASPPMIP
jgi:hypothetical protein